MKRDVTPIVETETRDDESELMKKHFTVVGAVIVRDELVYCARRGLNGTLPGLWEFPGGKVEAGESFEQALVREIDEELGCDISIIEPVETTTHEYDFAVITLATYLCELVSGEPRSNEHAEETWLPMGELQKLDWAPADIGQVPGSGVTADPSLYALSAMKVSATTSLSVSGRTRMRERARTSSPR